MTRVKICGINDPASVDAAVDAGADWLGFVFFPASPRYVSPKAAAALSRRTESGPRQIGLFVQPTIALIAQVLDVVRLDGLQIYGQPNELGTIKRRFSLPVWHPVAIGSAADLPTTAAPADMLVLEAKAPPGSSRPGGNATTFDWPVLRGWTSPAPWLLAGGLTSHTVAHAIEITGADAVDVSSGVESSKGVKDPALIRAFIAAAKSVRTPRTDRQQASCPGGIAHPTCGCAATA